MKKIKFLSLLLSAMLFLQCVVPVHATEPSATDGSEPTVMDTPITAVPDVEYGSASVNYGCRTINGRTPLGGSDKILQTSQAAFVYEANTQTVIYSYNPDERIYPGTLSKILTGLIAIENCDLNQKIVFTTRYNNGLLGLRNAELINEEELTIYDLVACVLVGSANDASRMIANTVAPNETAFVEMMNHRAQEIGCTDTYFTNCTGLDDPEQYTTARDMAKIVAEAYKNPTFREFFGMDGHTLKVNNRREEEKVIETDNHLMYQLYLPQFYDDRVTGGMASYSENAGAGLACVAEDEGMSLIMVTMGGTRTKEEGGWKTEYYGNFEEVLDLLEMSFGDYHICRLLYPGQALDQFPVLNGDSDVVGQSSVAFDTVLPSSVHLKNLVFRFSMENEGLSAPIEKDEQIGTVQIWYRTSCITETQMFAMNSVSVDTESGLEINDPTRSDSNVSDLLNFLGIAGLVIVIPAGLYFGVNYFRRALRRSKRRRRRASRRRSR